MPSALYKRRTQYTYSHQGGATLHPQSLRYVNALHKKNIQKNNCGTKIEQIEILSIFCIKQKRQNLWSAFFQITWKGLINNYFYAIL